MSTRAADPEVSIVIPVYNEEGILSAALADLTEKLAEVDWTYEILVAENGSTDATVAIAQQFSERHPEVHVFSTGEPNYGKALKEGILRARGTYVICDEIDLCDVAFYHVAMAQLKHAGFDFVVGSKRAQGSRDRRPGYRRAATTVLNGMLRVATGFQGTDTHGLKAFRRETVLPVVQACVVDRGRCCVGRAVRPGRVRPGRVRLLEVRINPTRVRVLGDSGSFFAAAHHQETKKKASVHGCSFDAITVTHRVTAGAIETGPATGSCRHPIRTRHMGRGAGTTPAHRAVFRRRRALPITETELRLIAAAASMGLSSRSKKGYSTPAATGTPRAL
jgi:hypothetical protein